MSEPGHKYRAFISYSHADTAFAKWLHRELESFYIDKDLVGRVTPTGPVPQALRPIFRDRDEFTAGHALADQTLGALDNSAALIVVCSPASAKSRYVNEEVRLFKSRHPERPVIPLIVDGKPDDPALECFPPAMKFKLDAKGRVTKKKVELLAADAREESDGKNLAVAKVVAGLLGVSSDDIFRRAERERRAAARRRRRVQVLVAALALLLALGGVGWLNQEYLRDQYYWSTMGPALLTANEERALRPKDEFTECKRACPTMVVVPSGTFMMGSPEGHGEDNEHPQHEVTIAKPLAVSKYEITFTDWDACVAGGGCPKVHDLRGRDELPVTKVSWDNAKQYATWLCRVTGKHYRLLSESEWEYAARAGTSTIYAFGDDEAGLGEYGWYSANSGEIPHPVGERKPNAFGLHDMAGNVWEWVEDSWHRSYKGAPSDGSAWVEGGDKGTGVIRGGSVVNNAKYLASAFRYFTQFDNGTPALGFRVVRMLNQ
jgi:formylglycine-generating enzyme required for sulfatase activity